MDKVILVYITIKNEQEAKTIAKALIEKKLIACANIFPITSLYMWQGKLVDDKEVVLLAKSKSQNYKKIQSEVKKLHSYQTPCIMNITAQANPEYLQWLMGEMK